MIYRIIASLLLVVILFLVLVFVYEHEAPKPASTPATNNDDASMKSLRIQ